MSNLKLEAPEATFEAWVQYVNNLPKSGKFASNTFARIVREIGEDGIVREVAVAITYHQTDIVTFHADGRIELYTAGWHTPTTKDRINRILPQRYGVSQTNFVWTLTDRLGEHTVVWPEYERLVLPASDIDVRWDREMECPGEPWRGGFRPYNTKTGQYVVEEESAP